jgi:hypothetical protein
MAIANPFTFYQPKKMKSINHLTFYSGFEYYIANDGLIIKAPIDNVFVQGCRLGRFECTMSHAKAYPQVYGFLNL